MALQCYQRSDKREQILSFPGGMSEGWASSFEIILFHAKKMGEFLGPSSNANVSKFI